jgi:transposase
MWYKAARPEGIPMTQTRRKFTPEFKQQALELAQELGSFNEAARQLGIRDSLLHNWKAKFKVPPSSKVKTAQVAMAEAEELKRLRKENEELKKVNYILKKAAAFFSQDHLK